MSDASREERIRIRLAGGEVEEVPLREAYRKRPLSALLARSGLVLNTRCGQRGLCRGCEVVTPDGERWKACQVPAEAAWGVDLFIPEKSLLQGGLSVAVDFQPRCGFDLRPLCGEAADGDHVLCIDVGTTTVVMALVELEEGRVVGRSSGYNAQVRMGEDVLTRIEACGEAAKVREAQELLLNQTLETLWTQLQRETEVPLSDVAAVSVAANTVMLHLLTGSDPSGLGKVPFRPVFLEGRCLCSGELPFREGGAFAARPDLPWYLLPGYGAFVGADIAGGWLASGMADRPDTSLLLDIGTNGEILLQHNGRLTGCATAAGPAFEGTQLSWGTRAIDGAISRLHGNLLEPGGLEPEWVGKRRARASGFCGSAYLDFLALGLESGLLRETGRFDAEVAEQAGIPLGQAEFGRSWLLDPEDADGPAISEADIALLLQAKAAIAAGLEILLRREGIRHEDVTTVFLAGGFGLNLGIESACACGLLGGFQPGQVEVVGNTALGGAYVAMLDRERMFQLERSTSGVEMIELNTDPDFEDCYIDHLVLGLPED